MATLFELIGKLSIQGADKAKSDIDDVTGTAQKSSGVFGTTSSKIAGAIGATFATTKIVNFGKDVLNTTQTFSDSMRKVQSLSGASGDELQKLNDTAIQYGSTTAWTSSQVADAMGYMALAGMDTNQILDATPGILSLASASGEDLARTSDILTDALTSFGYEAKDAAQFADVLATTQAKSNTTVDALGEAFKYAGTVAGTYKYSVEDVSAALGLMANAGVKGSMAGTAFSSIITRLGTNTRGARNKLEELGVSFYNADGTARPLSEVLTGLCDATANMTVEQKANIASQIAGQEAQKGLLAILNQGSGTYNDLKNKLDNCSGAATDMANTMESGIGGAMRTMSSAYEGFKIKLGQKIEPYLATALQKIASFVTNTVVPAMDGLFAKMSQLKTWMQEHKALIESITSIVGVLTSAIVAFKIGANIQSVVNGFQKAKITLALFSLETKGATVAQGFLNGQLTFGETIVGLLTGKITFAELATALWSKAQMGLNAVMAANPIGLVIAAIAAVIAIVVIAYNKSETFRNFVNGLWEKLKEFASWLAKGFVKAWDGIVTFFTETIPNAFNAVVEFFTIKIPNAFNSLIDWFKNLPSKIAEHLSNAIAKISEWASQTAQKAIEAGSTFITNVITFYTQLPGKIGYYLGVGLGKIASFVVNTTLKAIEAGSNFITNIVNFFTQLPGKILTFITNAFNYIVTWAVNMKNKAVETGKNFINAIVSFFKTLPGKIQSWLTNTINKATTFVSNMKSKGTSAGRDFVNNVISFIKNLPGKVKTWFDNTINKAATFVSNMAKKATDAGTTFLNNVVDGLSDLPSQVVGIGQSVVEGIWNGICNAGNWLYNQISDFASGIVQGFKDSFKINSPAKTMYPIGQGIDEGIGVSLIKSKASTDAIQSKFGAVMNSASHGFGKLKDFISNKSADISADMSLSDISIDKNIRNTVVEDSNRKYQVEVSSQFNGLSDTVERLIGLINDYLPNIANNMDKNIVLDTGAMVGAISGKIDQSLGRRKISKGRGNV